MSAPLSQRMREAANTIEEFAGHFDSIGRDMCPGSGIGYDLTVGGRPEPHQAWEAMTA